MPLSQAISLPAFLVACALALGALFAVPSSSYAAMGDMDAAPSSVQAEAVPGAEGDEVSGGSAAGASDEAEEAEQLGLMPRLYRLTGKSVPGNGDGALPTESVGAVFPDLLDVATTPYSINTGIECHMDEVCGYDPCTCGKPDAWGHCACGGFRETFPTVTITSSDPGIASVVNVFGNTWIVPKSPGTATITVSAELIHYQSAAYAFNVEVAPFGVVDVLLILACLVLVVAVLGGLFFLLRFIVRRVRKAMASQHAWKARGAKLKERYPLTWKAKLQNEKLASSHRKHAKHGGHRRPFVHDFLFSLRQVAPVFLGGLALFAILIPISTSVVNDVSIFNVNYTHDQIKYQLFAQNLAPFVNAASVIYGALLAVSLFRFLLAKRSTTAFFSVGLSRMKLFFSRYLAGLLCIVVGIGLPFVISLALNNASLGLYEGQIYEFFYVTCGYITVALVSFALAGIAVSCAGTLFEACSFTVALLAGVTVVLWGAGILADNLLVGNAAGATLYGQEIQVDRSFLEQLSWLNPLFFFSEEGASHQYFMALYPVYFPVLGAWRIVIGWFGAYIALCAFGLLALCRRRGEQAEMAGKASIFSLFSVAIFSLAAFSVSFALLGPVDTTVALVVAAVAFVLVSLLMLFGPLRGRTPVKITFSCVGGELAAMAIAVVVVATGAFGFSSYIPASDEVESVEVSYNGSPSYLTQGFSGVSSGASYYYTSYRRYSQKSSIDIVGSLHGQFVASAREPRETRYEDFQSTVVPYDVVLRYHLNNGREVVRYYDQATIGELSALLSLDNDTHTAELERAVITGETDGLSDEELGNLSDSPSYNAYRSGYIYLADGALNRIIEVQCSDEERAALLEAMATDLANMNASERYEPSKPARAALMFTLSPELDVSSFGYSFSNAVSYVTDDWTNTMAWLEESGNLDTLGSTLDPRVIERLTFQLDDPYVSINKVTSPVSRYFMAYRSETASRFWVTQDFGSRKIIEEQDKIADILPDLRMGCYMTGGYLVEAKLRGIDAYVYYYLPSDLAPDYL